MREECGRRKYLVPECASNAEPYAIFHRDARYFGGRGRKGAKCFLITLFEAVWLSRFGSVCTDFLHRHPRFLSACMCASARLHSAAASILPTSVMAVSRQLVSVLLTIGKILIYALSQLTFGNIESIIVSGKS